MATHFSILAWRIPGTGEPGGLPSVGLHRVGHNCSDLAAAAAEVLQLCSFSNCFGSLQGHMNLRTGFSTSQKKKNWNFNRDYNESVDHFV